HPELPKHYRQHRDCEAHRRRRAQIRPGRLPVALPLPCAERRPRCRRPPQTQSRRPGRLGELLQRVCAQQPETLPIGPRQTRH
ncbi:hypothetical protein HK405_009217, partial [Cladochytrium tenue]